MMNRVFAPEAAIDLEPLAAGTDDSRSALDPPRTASAPHRPLPPLAPPAPKAVPAASPRAPAPGGTGRRGPSDLTVLLVAMLAGVGLVAALGTVLLVQQWAGLQRNLSQERNLLLVERLRALGPATAPPELATPPAPVLDSLPAGAPRAEARNVPSFDGLPPPPPEEPWMEQLASLPPSGARPALLRVPVSPRLAAAAAAGTGTGGKPARGAGSGRERSSAPLPQLVGLVGAPGRAGSAIFQLGNNAMTVNVGEQIGGSGWLLRAADAESAVIERGAEVRRISIVSGG